MNALPSKAQSSFAEKKKRAVKMMNKSLARNAQNKRTHPDILKLQKEAVRAFFYDMDQLPKALMGGPLVAVQRMFARTVDQLRFRDLPGMRTDWYPLAKNELELLKARRK